MSTIQRQFACFGFLCLLAAAPARAGSDDLLGTWTGTSANCQGATLVLQADGRATLQGYDLQWSVPSAGQLSYVLEGQTYSARYALHGDQLTLTEDGEQYHYARQSAPRKQGALGRLGQSGSGQEDASGSHAPGYAARAGGAGTAASGPGASALAGAATGPTTPYQHPRGWYRFAMPQGWSVAQELPDGLLINPGLSATDTLDAVILVSQGMLEEYERNQPVHKVFEANQQALKQSMAQQGVQLDRPEGPAQPLQLGAAPAAVQVWRGKTMDGKPVRLWVGGLVQGDYYLTLTALLLEGGGDRFLPGIKQMFASMVPSAPERNLALEQAFAGHRVFKSDTSSSGSFSTTYDFSAGNQVKRAMLMSGMIGIDVDVGADTADWGQYEIVGDQLFLTFEDGPESAQIVMENGRVAGVRFGGGALYHFQ